MERKKIDKCSFIIYGVPVTKSNHNLVNRDGKKILPKDSKYAKYEEKIAKAVWEQVGECVVEGKAACVFNVFFKHKEQHPDLNNMTKSLCDGIEKSGLISNDRHLVQFYLNESYDYNNPRVEVEVYSSSKYTIKHEIVESPKQEVLEKLENDKKKPRKRKSREMGIKCVNCSKDLKNDNFMPVAGTKSFICMRCILVGT